MRNLRTAMIGAAVGALALLAGSTAAFAGTYPPPPDNVVIEWPTNSNGDSFITPGESFTITLCCFEPGAEVYITVDLGSASLAAQSLVTLGPFIVAADGTVAVDIPPLPAGTFQMALTIDGVTYTIPLIVGAVIPDTGADTFSLIRPAATLVIAGIVIVVVAQRRRRPADAAEPLAAVGAESA
ncbi:MAG: hypothetical protein ACO3C1_11120 [Ilumatobacteraceae bacterium]